MTKRNSIIVVVLVAAAAIAIAAYKSFPALAPAILPPGGDIAQDITEHNALAPGGNDTSFPLKVPDGFKIEVFADKLPGARVIVKDGLNNYWVSQPSLGQVSMIEMKPDGTVNNVSVTFRGLNKPHGLAIDPHNKTILYVAEENKISRVSLYSEDKLMKIADLPSGGEHTSRSIGFGPDGKLYVAIGSTCNVCRESDPMRAAIYTWTEKDGLKPFASGLRNTVFFTWNDGVLWGNDMGRDLLGDDLPPDELNIIDGGSDYGWPICYGKNIHDRDFDKNQYIRDPCADKAAPAFEYPAHSAPLGIAFAPSSWPAPFGGATIVAFHGSWNRSVPTGYKLVALTKNGKGGFDEMQDFISGWLQDGKALGRPVDVITVGDAMFVTDDKAGLVYRITYVGK